jgi:hypothetical protein
MIGAQTSYLTTLCVQARNRARAGAPNPLEGARWINHALHFLDERAAGRHQCTDTQLKKSVRARLPEEVERIFERSEQTMDFDHACPRLLRQNSTQK